MRIALRAILSGSTWRTSIALTLALVQRPISNKDRKQKHRTTHHQPKIHIFGREKVDTGPDLLTYNQEEAFAKTHLLIPKISEMSALTIDTLITTLRAASDAQFLTFMQLLNDRGIPLFHAAEAAPVVPVAEPVVPAPSDYRVCAADIDHSTCLGRVLKGGEDKRWKPIIYRESQCGKKQVEGGDLCTICTKNEAAYDGKVGPWRLRVTEEPPGWLHMLGTTWAAKKKPVFNASASSSSSASSSASTVGDSESDAESKDAAKATKAAAKAEAKAAKEAAAAAKAEAKAAKDAEKAAAKEAAAAEKAAAKEAKAAAKAIKDAAAAVTAAAKKAVTKPKEE